MGGITNKPLKLRFHKKALREFRKLDEPIRRVFKKKLAKLLDHSEKPMPRSRLAGFGHNYFKIKLKGTGYRLVYRYDEGALVILVLAIGKRERNVVYEMAQKRSEKD